MSQQVNISKGTWDAKKKVTNYQTPHDQVRYVKRRLVDIPQKDFNYKTKHYTDRYGNWYDKPPKVIYGGYNRPIRKYRQNYDSWSDTRGSWMNP